mmetsp:Transcript_61794/g.95925  ORF Transcript_61794/g.95925 Transcript_61794/m.95925 type:complete len:552 (-) Transcript_61794:80-1735(-)
MPVCRSLMLLAVSAGLMCVSANTFLKSKTVQKQERISEEDIQTSLLAEIEGTFGEGSASSRLKQMEGSLAPMYAALPKNENGYLSRSTVRYALHRLFVQRHGWFIKGLHDAGGSRNSTSNAGILKEQVPAYVQDLFEKRLNGRGFGLHELGVLAATVEHLVHNEAIKRLGDSFKVYDYLPSSPLNEVQVDEVLDMYMTGYILGENLAAMSFQEAMDAKNEMPEIFMAWNATREFVRGVRKNITQFESSAEQQSSGASDFSLVARVAERVGEQFGRFQDQECRQIKASLLALEEAGTGRVRLSDFWKPALGGAWQFSESLSYLRQLGVLDESDAKHPRVIIPNYVSSPSNCIASSSFYSVCCMDECEGLLGHLERYIAAPEASPHLIASFISELSSSSVVAPRKLSKTLVSRLEDIGAAHGGNVQLHGRLFAQWMHHAFPRECPYPHLSGTTNPQTPDEWLASTGEEAMATEEDIQEFVDQPHLNETQRLEVDSLPWSPEEELLARPVHTRPLMSTLRNVLLFAAAVPFALSIVRSASSSTKGVCKAEKFLV